MRVRRRAGQDDREHQQPLLVDLGLRHQQQQERRDLAREAGFRAVDSARGPGSRLFKKINIT